MLAQAAMRRFAGQPVVIEQFVDFTCEVSAVVARTVDGGMQVFPVAENIHTNHILDFSIVPARVTPAVAARAESLAKEIAARVGLVGVMGVEMFVTRGGEVLVNELAPRTHNSGHYTMDACNVSQFEQQVRAICGLPLVEPRLTSPRGDGQHLGGCLGERNTRLGGLAGPAGHVSPSLWQGRPSHGRDARWGILTCSRRMLKQP